MLITLTDITHSFADDTILEGINVTINAAERVGLVGVNGAGKTTFLRIITGQLLQTKGEVRAARGMQIGYLKQNGGLGTGKNVFDEAREAFRPVLDAQEELHILQENLAKGIGDEEALARAGERAAFIEARGGYNFDFEVRKILFGMGFGEETHGKMVDVLSGGERTRLALAKLLLSAPELLVLDEPTNHLDFTTLNWLEEFLLAYKGAVLVVSHDRYFLDRITTHIWELEDTHLESYKGNYSAFTVQKQAAIDLQMKAYYANKEKAAKLEDYIARNLVRASTSNMAKSRRKTLEKMEVIEKPKTHYAQMRLDFEFDAQPYTELITVKDLDVSIGTRELVKALDFTVRRGERLVIAGPNGAGKSTLLKVLSGQLKPTAGRVRIGQGAKFSVFEQQQVAQVGQVINAIWNLYPRMVELEVRSHLAKFGFVGEDVFKAVSALSGGELAKLRLAQMVLERPNLLFLDEPTNHLDIYTRQGLTEGLVAYKGTIVTVTHDRYLMQALACPVLYLEEGGWRIYEDYAQLLSPQTQKTETAAQPPQSEGEKGVSKNLKKQRQERAQLRQSVKELEERVEQLQADLQGAENLLYEEEVVKDHERMSELSQEMSDLRFALDEAFEAWVAAAAELDQIQE